MKIPQAKKYITDFEQMGFGMFVHWGLYSQIGKGEWVYALDNMKMTDYEKLKDTFTAENFDAEQLVLTAKNAGCKYITLTTRHHEGFSLYDTCGLSDLTHRILPGRAGFDKEHVDACRKYDIVPFFYTPLLTGTIRILKIILMII